ncbi:MAG TPA: hypothetical protein EYP17_07760 [Candidatus Latescibacteria bacterium]|nr:hypothetical protein [Candidatus Latescibacterota bacterium]
MRISWYMCIVGVAAAAAAQEVVEREVCWTSSPVVVDGVLDEPAWEAAERVSLAGAVDGSAVPEELTTYTRMLWDERNLYIAFECSDPDIWGTMTQRDASLWKEEVVEVFLDPDGDGENYAELEVSPNNTVVDLKIVRLKPWKSELGWDIAGLRTAVQVEGTVNLRDDVDRGWTAEIAIPWASLEDIPEATGGPPEDGTSWRGNLYRIERPLGKDWVLMAWSPVGRPAFHTPERFGVLIFLIAPPAVQGALWGTLKLLFR